MQSDFENSQGSDRGLPNLAVVTQSANLNPKILIDALKYQLQSCSQIFKRQRSELLIEIAWSVRMSEGPKVGRSEGLSSERNLERNKVHKKPKLTITQKIKVDTLYEQTPNKFLDFTLTQKQPNWGPKRPQITLKRNKLHKIRLDQHQKSVLKGAQRIEVVQLQE